MHEAIVGKIDKGKEILHGIEGNSRQISSKELMDGLNYVK
jgi:hypothetical protein